ncbi:MAG: helix-turn-helix domain-containing protein [Micropruina sp.]|nr:helix-turn-helix domain-containing protein [Micropruina sp.]
MAPNTSEDLGELPRLGPTRARVLALLQESAEPIASPDVAVQLGLHSNTARFHLDALVGHGFADRQTENRDVTGRPRVLYGATADAPAVGNKHYVDLAGALITHLIEGRENAAEIADGVGRAWGLRLAAQEDAAEGGPADEDDIVAGLAAAVTGLGFTSRSRFHEDATAIEITRCPYRQTDLATPGPVCSIHLGVLRGYLEGVGSASTVTSLEPWVTPESCIAHLAARSAD